MKQVTFLIFLCWASLHLNAQDLRITEIMYNPDNSDSSWEWVEVYNAGSEIIDLTGYVMDDNSGAGYSDSNIPSGSIPSGESVILFNASKLSESDFLQVWGTVNLVPVTRWSSLNNGGDSIGIWSSFEAYSGDNSTQLNTIEQVAYAADGEIWPEDDGSASIYLTNLETDNNLGTNWSLSTVGAMTPLFNTYTSSVFETNDGQDVGSPGLSDSTDTEKPVVICPENIDMASDTDNCGSTFPFLIPTGTDNVTEELVFAGLRSDGLELTDIYPVGLTTISWTAIDEAGNISEPCEQRILIRDDVAPTIVCPDTIEVLSADGNPVAITIALATASNACDGNIVITGIRSDEKELDEPFAIGETTITWRAVDDSDNAADCEQLVVVNFNASEENDITSFSMAEQLGESIINNDDKTILLTVPFGTPVDALVPTIEISEAASINPESGTAENFTNPVSYIVTAQDGSEQIWTVTVQIEEEQEEQDSMLAITSFMLVNADTNEDLFLIEEGMIIDINELPTSNLDIRANTNSAVESVRLSLEGALSTSRTESLIPYALYQDLPIGNYKGNDFIVGSYAVSAVPYSENSLGGDVGESFTLNFELIDSSPQLSVTSFTLINADTDEELFELDEDMVIDINSLPTLNLDLRANTTADVESVKLSLSGSQTSGRTESLEPYALFQDLPIGNYKGNSFTTGTYTVTGVPFAEDSARGNSGLSLSVNFELVDASLQVVDFMLVNADTDEDLFLITEGMVIDINELPTKHLDIRAITSTNVESVRLAISGAINSSRTESLVPYALFQDLPIGDYKGNDFVVGQYEVSATPYSENSLRGQRGMARTVNFEFTGAVLEVGAKKVNNLKLYPNPAKTVTSLNFEISVDLTEIHIYDFNGRLVETYTAKEVRRGNSYELTIGGLEPSNYIIRMKDTSGNYYQEQLIISQ